MMSTKRMLKATAAGLSMLCWCTAQAATTTYTTEIDGTTWNYTLSGSNATITGVTPADGNLVVPSSVDGYAVVSIGNNVGKSNNNIKSVRIPDSVTSIGSGAFALCTSLGDVVLGDGVTTIYGHSEDWTDTSGDNSYEKYGAFAGCVSLTNIVFGSSLRTISHQCFTRCTALPRLVLPDTVTTLGAQCFFNSTSLREVSIGTGLKSMGAHAFAKCTALKTVVFRPCDTPQLAISESAFRDCTKLETVTLSQAITSIGLHAFKSCSALKRIDIPDSVTGISAGAFTWCTSLGEVVLGDGVNTIYGHSEDWTDTSGDNSYEQYGAFAGCVSLTNIVFGSSLRTISHQCFTRCTALPRLVLPDTVTTLGAQCFFNSTSLREVSIGTGLKSMGAHAFAKCTALKTVVFRPCDTPQLAISESAFRDCTKLETVTLSQAITSIGLHAFKSCSALKRIDIPDSVTGISAGAFTWCTSLGEVVLGDGVTTIYGHSEDWTDTSGDNSYEQYGAFAGCVSLTNIVFGSSLRTISHQCFTRCTALPRLVLPDTVTTLGAQCFYGATSLRDVSIGTGLKSMGESAFGKCASLKSVVFRPCDTPQLAIAKSAFRECTKLESVEFSNAVTSIGIDAFKNCLALKRVVIPDSVTGISSGAFTFCTSLGEVVLGDGVTTIYGHSEDWTDTSGDNSYEQYGAFAGCVSLTNIVFGSSLRTISHQCFTRCTALPRLVLPDTVTTLGAQCFFGATNLRDVSIGTGLKSMGESAFGKCASLKNVVFRPCDTPQLAIAKSAFRECAKLESVEFSDAVTSIGIDAFKNCLALKRVVIPDSVTGISSGAFTFCTSLGEVVLGDGVTTIYGHSEDWTDTSGDNSYEQYGAFAGCVSLTNIVFGSSLRTISNQCFTRCTNLTSLVFPDSLTSIGVQAFYGCTMLGKVIFGNRQTSIGAYAFGNCPCLRYLYFRGDPPTTVGSNAFSGMKSAAIIYREDDNTEWPETWRGYAVKPASEITADADAPYDLAFYQPDDWPATFFLSDQTNSLVIGTRFLAGNPIYASFAAKDLWGDVDITGNFTNTLYISGVENVSRSWIDEDGLPAGWWVYWRTRIFRVLQNLPPGEYTATWVLNQPRSIRETNYANNTNTVTFTVVPSTAVTFMSLDYDVGTFYFEKGGTYGSKLPDAPVRFGYKFLGWFTAEEDGVRITESSRVPDAPTTLYAQWIAAPNETITVSSNPTAGTTWQSGNLYVVTENITVPSGVTLTIQPGAIVKFKVGKSLTVASGGTLRAQGTRAMPIVFTSVNDDANGGKTEGSTSKPNGGDWNRLQISGTAVFDFCRIYYTSGTENYGGLECGGTVTFDNSEIAETKYECVNAHSGGSFIARNSIFRDSSLAFGYYGGNRIRVYNCVVANCTTAVRQSSKLFYNTIFYNCRNFTDQSGDGSKFYYCCFFNPSGYGDQNSSKYARDTCIWADPQFVNVDANDYRIKATSPCVDAADGSVAPQFDRYGSPRMNVESVRPTGVANAGGAVPDIGIYEVPGTADVPAADLAVTVVSAPETLTIGKTARISWTVENVGEVDASGQWRDVVEIVTSNGQVLELGEQIATLDVRVGRSQTFTGDFTVPSGTEGACRVRVTANKYRDLFEGGRMDNNVQSSTSASTLAVSGKNIPTDGSETPVTLAAGDQTAFALDSLGGRAGVLAIRCDGDVSAWLGDGSTATKGNAVRTAVQVAPDLWLLEIPAGTDARVSLSNDGREPFSIGLSLAAGDFFLCDIGRITSLNTGTVTVPFAGNGFEDGIRCWLAIGGSKKVEAREIMIHDAVSGSAVFNVNGFAPGVYSIVVQKGNAEDSVEALELIRAQDAAARWNCGLELADTTRANRTYVGRFEYENLGDAPMSVPYVTLQSSGGTLIRLSESDAWTDSIDVLAISSTYPASSLKPGETGEIKFFYRSSGERATVTFKCAGAKRVVDEKGQFFKVGIAQPMQNGVVVYQDSHKKIIRYTIVTYKSHIDEPNQIRMSADALRPSSVDKLPWSFSHPKLADAFGDTWKTYIARLAEDADYLMKIGQPTYRVDKLLQLEMTDALGVDTAVPTLASATDIVRSGRGIDLAFTRRYSSSVSRRLTKGTLGYGWYGSYGTYAELKDAKTLIFHTPSGSSYSFTKVSGTWAPEDARDQTVLTETDTSYELASANGMVQKYAKGTMRLASIEDNQGNSLTFAYAGTKVSRVTHSDGQYLAFTYSGNLLTAVSDDLGHTVSYSYDGDKLATVTRVDRLVTHYAYRDDDGSSCAKALVQITAPDGTTRDFTYGSDGRLATVSVNGDKQTTRIVRGKFGSYTIVAPDGAKTEVTVGMNGETLKTVNALGQVVKQVYTADSLLESVIAPSGKRNLISYDKLGNPVSAMSASGATTAFSYTEEYGNLGSVTDPKGQVLAFGYDDLGRGVSSKFADGSETRVEYNAKGDVVKTTNRRGESVTYEYDGEGRLVKKTWDNGRTFTLAYDAKGNVVSAADNVTGTVTMEYDANERLSRIVYPKGRGFTYKYDDAGRVTERTMLSRGVVSAAATQRYAYDAMGRLSKVTDGLGADYLSNAYDPTTGRLVTQTYGNGTIVSNSYDALGRIVNIEHLSKPKAIGIGMPKISAILAFFEYTYDEDGKCVSQKTLEGEEKYTYDADGQLIAVTYPDGTSEKFTYDAVGNRITSGGSRPVATVTYTVNALNQYTNIDGTTLEYDLDGNMTRKGDTHYYYDTLNRLVAVTNTTKGIRWSCEYDVFGNRVSVTDNGTTTERLFVQGSLPSVAAEFNGDTLSKSHILVGAVRLADITGTGVSPVQTRYYHADMLGSARLLTDGTGATTGTRSFKAFGETRTSTGEPTDAGYVGTLGVETDPNGLLFMRNRYYDAGMGRFVQMDPIGLDGGDVNWYAYCMNSVSIHNDLTGLSFLTRFAAGSKLVANFARKGASWLSNGKGPIGKFGAFLVETGANLVDYGADDILGNETHFWKDMAKSTASMAVDALIDSTMADALPSWQPNDSGLKIAKGIYDQADWMYDTYKDFRRFQDECNKDSEFPDDWFELPEDEYETTTKDVVISWDPNEIKGPAGQGEKRYVQQGDWMDYTIYFENKTNATAAAQEVFVDLPMDPNLDWTTLELGEIAFGDHIDTSLVGKSHGKASYAIPGTNTFVKTTVTTKDGVLSWYMRDWDPTTTDNFPASATGGFLPPNDPDTHCGEGRLSFRVRVKSDAPDGAVIRASAQIVFDSNPMIETDPSWWNTVGTFHDVALEIDGVATNLTLIAGQPFGALPAPKTTRTGYTFDAWYTGPNGTGTKATPTAIVPTGDFSLYQNWVGVPYKVRFNANGGTGTMADQAFRYGTAQKLSVNAFKHGMYAFVGWATRPDGEVVYADGQLVENLTASANGVVTLYAIWTMDRPMLFTDVTDAAPQTAASVYDGYLYNKSTGALAGTIQVKVGKPGKDGKAAVKATVIGLDGKKKSLKAVEKGKALIESDGTTTVELVGGDACEVKIGAKGMSGTYGSYDIDGALNVFASKDAVDKATAAAVLGKWQGVVNVAWRSDATERVPPYHTLSVTIANKGKAKVAGTLADGTKVSASSQLLVGDEWCCVPVLEPKKSHLAFVLWLPKNGGSAVVTGLADAIVGKPGTLMAGAEFRMDALLGDAKYADYLPNGVPVTGGAKWVLPKAGKVQLAKDGLVDATKLLENPSALKLTYTAKTGAFKGSFKAYSDVNGKPKGVTVNVTGVLVDGVGYGAATIKKVGGVSVTISAP